MDALKGLSSLVNIDDQEDCLPRIQWDPLDDFLETLILLNFYRVFRELISGKHPE
jgi:hypothetical protein